jgi:hypothetical protein
MARGLAAKAGRAGVKRGLLAAVVLLAGCTHASVRVDSGGGTTTTSTSVSAGYSGHGSAAAWLLIGIGLIAAEQGGSAAARERGLEPQAAPASALDPKRQVNEVDCTRPIANWTANLKCK